MPTRAREQARFSGERNQRLPGAFRRQHPGVFVAQIKRELLERHKSFGPLHLGLLLGLRSYIDARSASRNQGMQID